MVTLSPEEVTRAACRRLEEVEPWPKVALFAGLDHDTVGISCCEAIQGFKSLESVRAWIDSSSCGVQCGLGA